MSRVYDVEWICEYDMRSSMNDYINILITTFKFLDGTLLTHKPAAWSLVLMVITESSLTFRMMGFSTLALWTWPSTSFGPLVSPCPRRAPSQWLLCWEDDSWAHCLLFISQPFSLSPSHTPPTSSNLSFLRLWLLSTWHACW